MQFSTFLWKRPDIRHYLLIPIAYIYLFLSQLRRALYSKKLLGTYVSAVPIVVVGNITMGGNGKTPLVSQLALYFKKNKKSVAIVSRGYPISPRTPTLVSNSSTKFISDEALMLSNVTKLPVVISADRIKAIQYLEERDSFDVIISDDGMQHYAMGRTIEIACFDTLHQLNTLPLPAGPFREKISRLACVDVILATGQETNKIPLAFHPYREKIVIAKPSITTLFNPAQDITQAISEWHGKTVRLISAIAKPQRLKTMITQQGLRVSEHIIFEDHQPFLLSEIPTTNTLTIITEKDHARLGYRRLPESFWVARLEIALPPDFFTKIENALR